MNKNQKIIVIVGVTLMVLMGLVPPFIMIVSGGRGSLERPVGYHFIFNKSDLYVKVYNYYVIERKNTSFAGFKVEIDIKQLIVQWFVVVSATGVLWWVAKKD